MNCNNTVLGDLYFLKTKDRKGKEENWVLSEMFIKKKLKLHQIFGGLCKFFEITQLLEIDRAFLINFCNIAAQFSAKKTTKLFCLFTPPVFPPILSMISTIKKRLKPALSYGPKVFTFAYCTYSYIFRSKEIKSS